MREVKGDLWEWGTPDVRLVTTNGFVKADGALVMGRGCAQEARDRWPGLDMRIGALIKDFGWDRVFPIDVGEPYLLMTFPVKPDSRDGLPGFKVKAELEIIEKSAHRLATFAQIMREAIPGDYVLPRPGCGNGGLGWPQVKEVLAPILDDRFAVITKPHPGRDVPLTQSSIFACEGVQGEHSRSDAEGGRGIPS